MRKWVLAAFVSCAVVVAQTKPTDVFEKAPPQIDTALRESLAKFFQAHIDGKFRNAEEVIAEDSKDFFYNMEKKRYLAYEVVRINYSENFTKATVVTGVEVEWRSPRIGVMRVKPPLTSLWRLEGDKWYWYIVPQKDWDTPWGRMNPGPDDPDKLKKLFTGVDVATVLSNVTIDRNELRLSSYQPAKGEALISNTLPGEIKLRMEAPPRAGLEAKLEKDVLKSGETAKVLVSYDPVGDEPKPRGEILVHVEPTGQILRIGLTFDIQPELRKLLPEELQKK
jgi:hypothetical protein